MREPIPSVSFDLHMGHLVSNIEVNYDALIAYMKEQGFDDTAIEDTSIYVLSNDTLVIREDGKVYATDGLYNSTTGDIALYPFRVAYVFEKYTETLDDEDKIEALRQQMSSDWSERFSQVLVHELEHKKRNPPTSSETEGKGRSLLSRSIGTAALSLQEYINNEEEAACEEAAKRGPKNLISFEIKR